MCVSTITTRRHDEIRGRGPGRAALAAGLHPRRPRPDRGAPRRGRRLRLLGGRAHRRHAATGAAASATCGSASGSRPSCRSRTPRTTSPRAAGGIAYVPVSPSVSWRDVEWLAGRSAACPWSSRALLTGGGRAARGRARRRRGSSSNHGGRQLDCVAASLDALPEVVERGRRPRAGADGRRRAPRQRRAEGGRARRPRGARRQADPLRARRGRRGRSPPRARAPAGGDSARGSPCSAAHVPPT